MWYCFSFSIFLETFGYKYYSSKEHVSLHLAQKRSNVQSMSFPSLFWVINIRRRQNSDIKYSKSSEQFDFAPYLKLKVSGETNSNSEAVPLSDNHL